MTETPTRWNWWAFGPPPKPASDMHVHACPSCNIDHACGMDCSSHPEMGPLYGAPVLCETCGENPDCAPNIEPVEWFICEVCLELHHASEGAADDLPRCCDDCWAAFHGEVPRG